MHDARGTCAPGAARLAVVAMVMASMASPAHAEPAASSYAQAMAEGRRRLAAKAFPAAVAAFRAALDARAEDPSALSELSWASLSAGDFAAAEQAAARATWVTRQPGLRAMAFYNHGRALEALGRLGDAQAAYSRSLDLRDNPGVRARLTRLGPALLTARRLAGPFASPEEFCKTPCEDVVQDIDRKLDASDQDVVDLAGNPEHLAKPPFVRVAKILTAPNDPDASWPIANIALQIGSRWYVLPDVGEAARGHGGSHAIAVRMAGPRLVLDWTSSIGRFGHHDERAMFACGVGGRKQPSCIGPIVTERSDVIDHCGKDIDCTTRPDFNVWFHCQAQLRGDVLVVTRNPEKPENVDEGVPSGPRPDACEALPIFGTHALTF